MILTYILEKKKKKNMNKKGFTLVEIIVVVALLGILFTIAIPGIYKLESNAKDKALKRKKEAIEIAAENFAQKNSFYIIDVVKDSYCDLGSNDNNNTITCKMSIKNLVDLHAYKDTKYNDCVGESTSDRCCLVANPKGGCLEDDYYIEIEINKKISVANAELKLNENN